MENMSLLNAVLETINDECINGKKDNVVAVAYIHPSLALAIKANGEELPNKFDPNIFNQLKTDNFPTIDIEIQEQDHLITYSYEPSPKTYFDMPTKSQLRVHTKNKIMNSNNNELEELYKEVIHNLKYCPAPSLLPEFEEEKKWILTEMKKRNMKIPTFLNKLFG